MHAVVGNSGDLKGSRLGKGDAFVVVHPSTIQQALDCLQASVDADACVIPQGANTGLTGGSVDMRRHDWRAPESRAEQRFCAGRWS